MENLLRSKGYWSLVETGYEEAKPETVLSETRQKQLDELMMKDLKVKNYLFQAIDRITLQQILEKKTSKQIWDSMKKKFEGNARVKRSALQGLRRNFEILEMKIGETITDYFARVMTVVDKIRSNGEQMKEVTIVEKILRTLTEKFNYIVVSIEESKNIDLLTIDELQSSLVVHEQKFHKNRGEEQALKVSHEERFRSRGRGRTSFRRGRGGGRQFYNKAVIECFKCHQLGHYQYECPQWDKQVNYAELDENEEMLLMVYVEKNKARRNDVWFLDSGCSNHMCGDQTLFYELDKEFKQMVKLGDNTKIMATGKGNVRLNLDGTSYMVTEVFFVPQLKNHLLSIGQLQERGLAILLKSNKCKIYHPSRGLIIQTDMTANRMFVLLSNTQADQSQTKGEVCLQATTQNLAHLWHRRYGHISYKGLKTLQLKDMVRGLPMFPESSEVCTDCLRGKQHREFIPKRSTWRANQKLALVHADICGPISPISNSNKRYLICYIDDYSRKAWVNFLVEKSEAFAAFKLFKERVEKESGLVIKCLRTDRGGEFTSMEFNEYCQKNGIKRQLTTAYTPQQNGVAERKNRTVMNMVRCLLSEKGIPKTFWPEAVNWSFYVLNRSPTVAVKDVTPEEAWSGIKPSVEHFRVFGSIAHVHVPEVRRTKLEDKSYNCVLLGISDESKGYRLYEPISKKVVVSRDVVFEENKKWIWDKNMEDQVLLDLEWGDEEEMNEEETNSDSEPEAVNVADDSEGNGANSHGEGLSLIPNMTVSSGMTSEDREGLNTEGSSSRGGRHRRLPVWMEDYETGEQINFSDEDGNINMALFSCADPMCYEEAVKLDKWRQAMDLEMKSIDKNGTWFLTELPRGAKRIGLKWVYKTKLNEHGEIEKYKARLVAKGYAQEYGVDYEEVFAPVARMDTVRMILAVAAQRNWTIYQLDVKSAFLHGMLNEDVYVEQPKGYEVRSEADKVYKLNKALYGLKQAPRAWFSLIESYFLKEGFGKCDSEQTLFTKIQQGKRLIISVYVDDLIYTGDDEAMINDFKVSMMREFEMSDLGKMKYFLGIEVVQFDEGIFISQKRYALEILKRFGMEGSNEVQNPIVPGSRISKDENGVKIDSVFYKKLVGSMMYLTATRPDIMFAVSLISRYMSTPTELHLMAAKRILRYLQGTAGFGILYAKGGNNELIGFTDSDYAGCLEDRKSTSGYVFMLSSGAVAWSSRKQPIVTLSTTEAEFVAAAACSCQAVWMKRIMQKLGYDGSKSTTIYCDNSSAIKLSKNPVMHGRSKHIDVRFHFLRELAREGIVHLKHCGTQEQIADVLTKPLKTESFQKFRNQLGVCNSPEINYLLRQFSLREGMLWLIDS